MIYKKLLADEFYKLHPMLQKRYELPLDANFYAEGTMQEIKSGNRLLKPFYYLMAKNDFLFPESGQFIPFSIRNESRMNERNEGEVFWERTFHFPNVSRKFNATMTVDFERRIVKDYLGKPARFYSDLLFNVTKDGQLLIRSNEQRFVFPPFEINLPKYMHGKVTVLEGYDDVRQCYTIDVFIYNNLFGRMMHYAGTFKQLPHESNA